MVKIARVFRLTRSWWKTDRIRVSPNEGALLTLEADAIVLINDRVVQVTGRTVNRFFNDVRIIYDCKVDSQTAVLTVHLRDGERRPQVNWTIGDVRQELLEQEVSVFRKSAQD